MKNIIAMALILVLGACSAKKDDTTTTTPTALEGSWVSNCYLSGSEYKLEIYTISGNAIAYVVNTYTDSYCTTANKVSTSAFGGTLAVEGASSTITGAYNMTNTILTAALTPTSDAFTASLNAGPSCGSSWTINTEKSILGCSDFNMTAVTAGSVHYDLFKIDTSVSPNTAQFGNSSGCTASICTPASARPTALGSLVYTKI